MPEFLMPSLGADMAAGTLVAWRKRLGERVQRGEILAEVETEKGIIEVESFTTGVLERILVSPGEKVPVGTPLATIRDEDSSAGLPASAPSVEARAPEAPVPPFVPIPPASGTAGEVPARARVASTPAARKLARERGVDLAAVRGSGPGGAVTRGDVERTLRIEPAAPTAPAESQARMRQAIAAAMTRSKREIPHYYLATTVDVGRAVDWLAEQNESRLPEDRLLLAALVQKAVAVALRDFSELNQRWEGERATLPDGIHVGTAIALRQGGLVAPAIRDTDKRSVAELMTALRDLVRRARTGRLRSSELSDATITVTNLGEQGVETVFGVIYPPQVALVGFGRVAQRPWVVDGRVEPRAVTTATLSADHRVSDGHRGALFLAMVDRLLQEPSRL